MAEKPCSMCWLCMVSHGSLDRAHPHGVSERFFSNITFVGCCLDSGDIYIQACFFFWIARTCLRCPVQYTWKLSNDRVLSYKVAARRRSSTKQKTVPRSNIYTRIRWRSTVACIRKHATCRAYHSRMKCEYESALELSLRKTLTQTDKGSSICTLSNLSKASC